MFYFVTLTSLLVCFIRHLPPLGFFYLFILKCTISHDYPIASLFFPNEVIHWKPLTNGAIGEQNSIKICIKSSTHIYAVKDPFRHYNCHSLACLMKIMRARWERADQLQKRPSHPHIV